VERSKINAIITRMRTATIKPALPPFFISSTTASGVIYESPSLEDPDADELKEDPLL